MSSHQSFPQGATTKQWVGLAVLALPTLLVSFDFFVLLMAVPRIAEDLQATSIQQLWIVDIYGFLLGGFMLMMGALGDRIGRRRLLLWGALGFGLASVAAAFSTSPEMLIFSRAALGITGATLAPSTLALISGMFRDERQRGIAIGIWGGCFTLGAIIGPLVGGIMLEYFWWGSVFLLGVPAMVLLLLVGPALLPEFRLENRASFDLLSIPLSLLAVLPLVHGLKEMVRHGFDLVSVTSVIAGVVFAVIFLLRQRRVEHPMLDLGLFANRAFSGALIVLLVNSMVGGAFLLSAAQYAQGVDGLQPVMASLVLLPGMITATISFVAAPVLTRYISAGSLVMLGLVVNALAFVAVAINPGVQGSLMIAIAFAVMGLCSGPIVGLGTGLVIGNAPLEKAGTAGSLTQTSNEFGTAFGIAIFGSLAAAVYRLGMPSMPEEQRLVAIEGIAAARGALDQAGIETAKQAFDMGLRVSAGTSALVLLATALLALAIFRGAGQRDPALA